MNMDAMDGLWCPPRSLYPIVASYFVSGFKSKNHVLGLEFSVSSALPSCAMWSPYVEIFSFYFELNLIACVICTTSVCSVCGGEGGVRGRRNSTYRPRLLYKFRILYLLWYEIVLASRVLYLHWKKNLRT